MTTYEIINPSDVYTIYGEPAAVAAAVILLGLGLYGIQSRGEDGLQMPTLRFCGDADAMPGWWAENIDEDEDFEEYVGSSRGRAEVAAALDTVLIGSIADRELFEEMVSCVSIKAERDKLRATHHDRKRSSMNDIGARADQLAEILRDMETT